VNIKQISTLVIAIVATAFVTYFFMPSKTVQVEHSITLADTGRAADERIEEAIKERDKVLQENGWLKRQLKLAQVQHPVDGAVSDPVKPPIVEIPVKPDTAKQVYTYPFDFPISCSVTRNRITFLTMNPFLRYNDKPYVKTYEFDRATSDFDFALIQTEDYQTLTGIVLKSQERFFSFDGIAVGAGAMFPKHFYALLELKFSMYERLSINPRVTSYPEAGIELKYDVIK
jgi:hypothetical protein